MAGKPFMNRRNAGKLAGLLAIGFAYAWGLPARAQIVTASTSNGVLQATVGISGALNSANVTGRFQLDDLGIAGASPTILQFPINNTTLLGSYVTLRIDGGPKFFDDDNDPNTPPVLNATLPGWDIIFGEATTTFGTGLTGQWVVAPTATGNRIRAVWETIATAGPPATPRIRAELDLSLVYDIAIYSFKITNLSGEAHSVGLRFAQDYSGPGGATDAPVIAPNASPIVAETDLLAGQVLPSWRVFSSDNARSAGGLLNLGGIAPSRLVFGGVARVLVPYWDFTADPAIGLGSGANAAAGVYWEDTTIPAGQSLTFTTAFGRNHANYVFGQQLVAGLDGPISLKFDKSKYVSGTSSPSSLSPNPMTITAVLHNKSQVAIQGNQAVLSLPSGWTADRSTTQTVDSIPSGGTGVVAWQVTAAAPGPSGKLPYSVSWSIGTGGQGIGVTREIEVPALPDQPIQFALKRNETPETSDDIPYASMVAFPYGFDDPTPSVALGLNALDFDLVRWNPATNLYEIVQFLKPGEGYWMVPTGRGVSNITVNLQGAQPVTSAGGNFEIKLKQGWNQISNPFLLRIRWGDVRVLNTDASDPEFLVPLTVEKAGDLQHAWILPHAYPYDVNRIPEPDYIFGDSNTELLPFQGVWVKALKPTITLIMPQPVGRAAQPYRTRAAISKDGWLMRLVASNGYSTDAWKFFGLSREAKDAYDGQDIESPPTIDRAVSLNFVRDQWAGRSAIYSQDVQSLTPGRKTWRVRVASSSPNAEVTLTWPEIGKLPKSHELYILDEATSIRRVMRQTSSLVVNTGENASRLLTIIAEPRTAALPLRITNAAVQGRGAGSASIGFAATRDASIRVRILQATGAPVRALAGRAVSGGVTQSMTWDYRDSRGISVPAGAYRIEIRATSDDGQTATAILPHVVVR